MLLGQKPLRHRLMPTPRKDSLYTVNNITTIISSLGIAISYDLGFTEFDFFITFILL